MNTASTLCRPPRTRQIALIALLWCARLTSAVSVAILSLFLLDELGTPTVAEWLKLACFPFGVMAGMVFAWYRPFAGGFFALASLATFYILHIASGAGASIGPYFLLFTSPAILFIAVGIMKRSRAKVLNAPAV